MSGPSRALVPVAFGLATIIVMLGVFVGGANGAIDPQAVFWVVGAFALVGAVWSTLVMRRNARDLQRFANRHGWAFEPQSLAPQGRFRFAPFGRGHSKKFKAVASGNYAGMRCMTFTYIYVTGSGKNRTTHVYTIDVVDLPGWLPHLEIAPEGFGSKLAKAMGGQDIEVESAAFNEKWRVTSRSPRYAHAVLHPRMLQHLLVPRAGAMAISIDGAAVVGSHVGSRGPDDLLDRMSTLIGVARRIPDHVWREFGAAPRKGSA